MTAARDDGARVDRAELDVYRAEPLATGAARAELRAQRRVKPIRSGTEE